MKQIPYGRQDISQEDIQAVIDTLSSDWLTQGPAIEKFEKTVANYCGAQYAVAVNSATSALHIACLAAGLGPEDSLWTSPNTFVASANCGLYCGAAVDFVDIDSRTYNMDPALLEEKLIVAGKEGKLPKVVVPVHFSGQACEMERIAKLAAKYGVAVIEDASHAIGGKYKDTRVGCCEFSDMAVFSFHPVKIVTTAEGGMILTNRRDLYEKLMLYRSHGITRNPEMMTQESHGPWYYEQIGLGYNYRITDVQAALGNSQMKRIDQFVARRHEIAKRYDNALENLPLALPWQHPDSFSAFHLYVIKLRTEALQKTHLQIFEELRRAGIGVNLHYIPVHTQPYYQTLGFKWGDFPAAEAYYRSAISLPMYYGLTEEDQDYVIDTLKKVLV